MRCLRCGAKNAKKNGFVKGKQRYKCRVCGYQYTVDKKRGMNYFNREFALILYTFGLSRSYIAKVMGVSVTTICRLVSMYYTEEFIAGLKERKAKAAHLLKVSPKDILQEMIIRGIPRRALENDAYVIHVETENGSKIDMILEVPQTQKS